MNSDAIGVLERLDRAIDRLAIPAGHLAQPVASADMAVVSSSGSQGRQDVAALAVESGVFSEADRVHQS